jgi:hypothetical protein
MKPPERFAARNCNKMQSLPELEWHAACNYQGAKARRKQLMSVRYRISDPTIAMFQEKGGYVARTVAVGTVVEVSNGPIDGDRLVDVVWDGRDVMMFTQDLRSRAERIE